MQNYVNQQRIKSMYKMLFEMATGNLAFRVELDGCGGELDELAAMLNAVAEKMKMVISKPEFLNQQSKYQTTTGTKKQADTILIQKVLDYIQNHLEEPLPSTKELSKMFGTNEFKLKEGFRESFNTSIYQFYNNERLKKAHLLIQQTTISLKEIAFMSGFNDYTNFYKAFKKKFNYAPSEIKRKEASNESDI